MDSIKRAVFDMFCPGSNDWHLASSVVSQMIKKICDDNAQESSSPEFFIFDSPHIYPEDLLILPKSNFIIVFLGYTDINPRTKMKDIRSYDSKDCWTQKLSEEQLLSLIKGNIEYSEEIKEQCYKYGFPYFDTSKDMNSTLIRALNYIVNNNNDEEA
jgi:hypothetical protein